MKKIMLIITMCFAVFSFSTFAQIKVSSNGYVGINNTNPTYRLDVSGTFRLVQGSTSIIYDGSTFYPTGNISLGSSSTYSQMWYNLYAINAFFMYAPVIISDVNFKTDVTDLIGVKEKLRLLRPVSYNLDTEKLKIDKDIKSKEKGKEIGFIAQELREVFPEIVTENEDGVLGVKYTELIPVLVQAIKEQQEEIDALNKRITALEEAGK
jgi:hypothetical protein